MENEQTFEDEEEILDADSEQFSEESSEDEFDSFSEDVNDQSSDFLAKAKEITGREFKDEEDFKKHYKNLSSFVGKKTAPTPKVNNDRVAELEFKVDHPEYKEHFDVIKMVARERGKSYNDVVDDPMVKEIVEVRQSRKGESVIHSNNKISSNSSSIAKLRANVNTEDGLAEYLKATLGE